MNLPISSGAPYTVRSTKVAVDHLVYPAEYRRTYIVVEVTYRPSTVWRFLGGPQDIQTHQPFVTAGHEIPVRFAIETFGPKLATEGDDVFYRYEYSVPWVGTGNLVDVFQVDGKSWRVIVPFDDHRNVPRPADMTVAAW